MGSWHTCYFLVMFNISYLLLRNAIRMNAMINDYISIIGLLKYTYISYVLFIPKGLVTIHLHTHNFTHRSCCMAEILWSELWYSTCSRKCSSEFGTGLSCTKLDRFYWLPNLVNVVSADDYTPA